MFDNVKNVAGADTDASSNNSNSSKFRPMELMGADYLEDQKPQTYSYTLFSQTTDGKLKKINMKGSFTLQKSNDCVEFSTVFC